MRINKKLLVSIGTFIFTALLAFTVFSIKPMTTVNAGNQNETDIVSSAEEASSIAGFKAEIVSNAPAALQRVPEYYVHEVRKGAWEITQLWTFPGQKATIIGLVQTRYGNLIGKDLVPFTYKNVSGLDYVAPEKDDKPGRIDLFWRKGEIGYYIFGNLEGNIDENAVMEMANSIATSN